MPATEWFCPGCRRSLPPGLTNCPTCGLLLVGPEAEKLWALDGRLRSLMAERNQLVEKLRGPQAQPASGQSLLPSALPPPSATPGTAGPSGQQVVLGLGALLLLAAVSFFILVFWTVVGVVGQAVILLALIGCALLATRLAARRSLSTAAETAAVITTGLLLLTVQAAHGKGLFGLDRFTTAQYWTGAAILVGLLLLGFERVTPAEPGGRRILTFRPAGNAALALAPWIGLGAVAPHRLWLTLGLLCVATIAAVHLVGCLRIGWRRPWIIAAPAASLGLAVVAAQATGILEAYRLDYPWQHRYGALVVMLLLPALAALVRSRLPEPETVLALAGLAAIPAIGVPLLDCSAWLLTGIAAVAGVLLVLAVRAVASRAEYARIVAAAALPSLVAAAAVLRQSGATTLRHAILHGSGADHPGAVAPVIATSAVWLVTAIAVVAGRREQRWILNAQPAAVVTVAVCLWDAPTSAVAFTALGLCLVEVAIARVAASRQGATARVWELSALAIGLLAALSTLAADVAAFHSPRAAALVLYVLGVAVLVLATGPGRLAFSYPGAFTISAGTWCLLADAHVSVIEAYTLPLALLLALIGLVQWRRDPSAPSMLILGPALTAALEPSTLKAIAGGDQLRTLAVLVVDVALLGIGYRATLKAPVLLAGISVVLIGLTRGGRLITHVNGWVVLLAAAAALLTLGVRWEQATLSGRRAARWFAALR